MKVTQEKRPQSQLALNIEIPADVSKKAYEKVVRDLSKTLRIPGFRKGKVPRQVLLQRLGPGRVRAEALEGLVQDSIDKAVKQAEVDALGNYKIEPQIDALLEQYKPGEVLTFTAVMDVPPEVELGNYQALCVQAEEVEYDPAQVEKYLEGQRSRLATLVPVEGRPAQRGDVVVVNYSGRLPGAEEEDDTLIEGAQASDFELELESGKFLEDLVNGIEGMAVEETKEVSVQFPDDYGREDLAGQSALFDVVLNEIKEKELPELDDEFAEEVSEFETLAALREDIEAKYKQQAEDATKANTEAAIAKALLEVVETEVPETLIEREVNLMIQQSLAELERYGVDPSQIMTPESAEKLKAEARPEAIERLTTNLALQEVANVRSIEPDSEKMAEQIAKIYEQMGDQQLDRQRVEEFVSSELLEAQAMEWLCENLTIELVPAGSLQAEADSADDGETGTAPTIDVDAETVEVAAESV